VRALVTIGGYNVQDTVAPPRPAPAVEERAYWYQWYFNTERGRVGLAQNRREVCRLLWQEWSPTCIAPRRRRRQSGARAVLPWRSPSETP
jgi:hypothetical protein